MLTIDLTGKHALVAGVADDGGFGFAIAKAMAEAGADFVVVGRPVTRGADAAAAAASIARALGG